MSFRTNNPIICKYLKSQFCWGEPLLFNGKIIPYKNILEILKKIKEKDIEKFKVFQLSFLFVNRNRVVKNFFPNLDILNVKRFNQQILNQINYELLNLEEV